MGRAAAGDLDRVLAGLGQGAGIGSVQRLRTRRPKPPGYPGRRRPGVQLDLAPVGREAVEGRSQRIRRGDGHGIGERGGKIAGHLARIDEQRCAPRGLQDGEGECDRHVADVRAPHVEQPGDRIGRAENHRVDAAIVERLGDRRTLGGGIEAGEFRRVRDRRRDRRRRLIDPHRIDRVVVDRGEPAACLGAGRLQPRRAVRRVQPGVVAERAIDREVGGNPVVRRLLRQVPGRESRRIDLVFDLEGVTPVDEDRRLVREHHREPGRAVEAGQPGEALRSWRDELALVLVGQRHHEAVEPQAPQLRAQRIEPFRRRRAAAEIVIGRCAERRRPRRPEGDVLGAGLLDDQPHPVGRPDRHRGGDDAAQESLRLGREPIGFSHAGLRCGAALRQRASSCPCSPSPPRLCSTAANATIMTTRARPPAWSRRRPDDGRGPRGRAPHRPPPRPLPARSAGPTGSPAHRHGETARRRAPGG